MFQFLPFLMKAGAMGGKAVKGLKMANQGLGALRGIMGGGQSQQPQMMPMGNAMPSPIATANNGGFQRPMAPQSEPLIGDGNNMQAFLMDQMRRRNGYGG